MSREGISKSISEKIIVEIPLSMISDKNINPRVGGVNLDNVNALVEANDFPEIHLGLIEGEYVIVDGYHRFAATQKLERDKIRAFIIEYKSFEELRKAAFVANVNHGLKLTDLDIALSIYDFYIEKLKVNATTNLSAILREYEVPERAGRILFFWAVINREVLENNSVDLTNKTKCETLSYLLNQFKEEPGKISITFKENFKTFYNKYSHLQKENLREAMKLYVIGKDYYLEKEKEEELMEEMKKSDIELKDNESETISKDDLIDRNGNLSNTSGTVEQPNDFIDEIKEETNKIKEDSDINLKSASNKIASIGEEIMTIRMMQSKDRITFTENDYKKLQSIMDVMGEIIGDIAIEQFNKTKGMI